MIESSKFDIKSIDLWKGAINEIDVWDTENIWVQAQVIGLYE